MKKLKTLIRSKTPILDYQDCIQYASHNRYMLTICSLWEKLRVDFSNLVKQCHVFLKAISEVGFLTVKRTRDRALGQVIKIEFCFFFFKIRITDYVILTN